MLALIQSIEWNPLRWAVDIRMRLAVFLLRAYAGTAFVWVGYHQWKDPNFAVNLPSVLMSWAQQNPFFFYEDILRYIATPNAHIVALVLPYLQMAIGGLLVLGLFTRWTTLAFAFLTLNFFFAVQHTHPAAAGMNIGFMAVGLILFFAEAGQAFGLDQIVQVLGLRYGWIKPPKRKKKRVRLGAPRPLAASKLMPAKLKLTRPKEIELPEKKSKSRDDREGRDERRVVELPTRDKRKADAIENKLGATLKKLKERQQLKAVQSGNQNRLRHYEPDELDDDDEDEEDDIYAYYGDDDDDDD